MRLFSAAASRNSLVEEDRRRIRERQKGGNEKEGQFQQKKRKHLSRVFFCWCPSFGLPVWKRKKKKSGCLSQLLIDMTPLRRERRKSPVGAGGQAGRQKNGEKGAKKVYESPELLLLRTVAIRWTQLLHLRTVIKLMMLTKLYFTMIPLSLLSQFTGR